MAPCCCFRLKTSKIFLLHILMQRLSLRDYFLMKTKDFMEGFREFKSVRLISPEGRRLPKSLNDRTSHTNKTEKSDNNNR